MGIPNEYRHDVDAMPPALRALLDAELAAGNEIAEVGHSFPAPPVGAFFLLKKPISTRPQKSGDGIDYYDRNSSIYSGEITDAKRFFFILEPPHPPELEPDMDAIRAAHASVESPPRAVRSVEQAKPVSGVSDTTPETPLRRFERSMVMDYEKWHDGIGYDLEALRDMSPGERTSIETILIHRRPRDWRDIEALAAIDTPRAREAIKAAINDNDAEVRAAVTEHAPGLIPNATRTVSLVKALKSAVFYGGLTQMLDQVEEFHPPEVIESLLQGALKREGEVAVHFAAMLFFLHGKASEPFDWNHRPFFLRFHTTDREERAAVFRELCAAIGVSAEKFLAPNKPASATTGKTRKKQKKR